ncbi:MAG: hypothetical protein RIS35_2841 [Pseudomonadota bacterium]|jgi:hypothetical protein
MRSQPLQTVPRRSLSGVAAVELALLMVIFVPLVFVGFELSGLIRADLALRSAVRAGAQAPLLASPINWSTSSMTTAVRAAALADVDPKSLPGFSANSVTASVLCACAGQSSLTAPSCTVDLNDDTLDEFGCRESDGTFTPPRIYVLVRATYGYSVSLLPSDSDDGQINLTRDARMRIQ